MRRFPLVVTLLLAFAVQAFAIQIDMTDGFVQVTGPTTMRVNNVLSMGSYYWADLEWDSTSNTFHVANVGPMNCASMEGLWTLHYDWGCVGSSSRVTIQFFGDGTFLTGESNTGTWSQNGCDVDWVYSNNTHYWGVMESNGLSMSGDMHGDWAGDGCWTANRSFQGRGDPAPALGDMAPIGSDGRSSNRSR